MIYFAIAETNGARTIYRLKHSCVWPTEEMASRKNTNSLWERVVPVRVEETAHGVHIASTLDGKFWMRADRLVKDFG